MYRVFEKHDKSYGAFFDATEILVDTQSTIQNIKILNTEVHGKVMLLDGICMLTESTHFVYHEMMTHTCLACIPAPRHVLVIGGGDGGTVTELAKYTCLESITLVELDPDVVTHAKTHFPEFRAGFEDPRTQFIAGDGAAFLKDPPQKYDAIIIDSTDICDENMTGEDIAFPLATKAFYADAKHALNAKGAMIQVQGSPHFYGQTLAAFWQSTMHVWQHFTPLMLPCPFYISGDWCAGLMTETGQLDPVYAHALKGPLRYFNHDVARGALALPNFVREMLTVNS